MAGLVGVVGGYFGEVVLLVGVGWLVLRLCFGLFLLSGSWSGSAHCTSFQLRGSDTFTSALLGKALAFPRPNSLDF